MTDRTQPHLIGEGRLVVPPAESDSRRYGTVLLLDEHGNPVQLREMKAAHAAALTATVPAPIAQAEGRRACTELLGVGALFFERSSWNDRPALAVGVRPRDGRQAWWLEPGTLGRLKDIQVQIEAHRSWPRCACLPVQEKPDRRKRGDRSRRRGGAL
ncbi:hypothetical protein [Glycomyces tenuis]|uniref:hypothetical protein n=1 Tax=Glycomyces tenuis TaxID=58116 RepID=UPI000405E492|nr:hypothetical protein [Glycomyces tenuis]